MDIFPWGGFFGPRFFPRAFPTFFFFVSAITKIEKQGHSERLGALMKKNEREFHRGGVRREIDSSPFHIRAMHLEIIDPHFGPQEWQEIAEPSQGCKKRRERVRVSLFLGVVAGALIPHLERGQRRWQPYHRERKQSICRAEFTRIEFSREKSLIFT